MNYSKNALIIGGGITGLAAAYRLQQQNPTWSITLIEQANYLGGKIQTEQTDGFILEAGPDCFLSRKPRGIGLCEELGISTELVGRNPRYAKTYVLRHGRLHRLPEGLTGMIPTNLQALTKSTLLSSAGQARVAQELTLPPQIGDTDESVANFIRRRLGDEAFDNLIEPLMGGIYAGQAHQLSLAATFPQLRQLETKHGSLIKGLTNRPATAKPTHPPFVSFPQGMGHLVKTIISHLDKVEICLNTTVTAVTHTHNHYHITTNSPTGEQNYQTPIIIFALPAHVLSHLLMNIDNNLAHTFAQIPYASSVLVNLAFAEKDLPQPLDGYGYVIPSIEQREALACTWTWHKWHNRAPQGQALIRVYLGRYGQADVTQYDDKKLLQMAHTELAETLSITAVPQFHRIHRWPLAMPQYNMGHLNRLEKIEARLSQHPGLFVAGAAYRGVGIPDCIHSGEVAAKAATSYANDRPNVIQATS